LIIWVDSAVDVTAKAQQEPQEPWLYTGVTAHFVRQSTLLARSGNFCKNRSAVFSL